MDHDNIIIRIGKHSIKKRNHSLKEKTHRKDAKI